MKNLALALTGRFDMRWDTLADYSRVKFFSRVTLLGLMSESGLRDIHFETIGRVPMFARAMLVSGRVPI
jgi:2-polyprenyl-6-hydroxyphenyl methylase/3-demethylubiquinone-9 3-methyltransferase